MMVQQAPITTSPSTSMPTAAGITQAPTLPTSVLTCADLLYIYLYYKAEFYRLLQSPSTPTNSPSASPSTSAVKKRSST